MGVVSVSGPAGTPKSIHQLKVTLRSVRPPVWRRLQVPSTISLGDLHFVLQAAMGWEDYHLHLFSIGGETYADDRVEGPWGGRQKDEDRARLDKVAPLGARLRYEYDFGDGWEHDIVVEKVLPPEPGVTYPRCLTGRRACPRRTAAARGAMPACSRRSPTRRAPGTTSSWSGWGMTSIPKPSTRWR